jgi:hypothetical protein
MLALHTALGGGLALAAGTGDAPSCAYLCCKRVYVEYVVMARRWFSVIKLQTPRLAFPRLLIFPYRSKAKTSFLYAGFALPSGFKAGARNRSAQCRGLDLSSQVC